MVGVTALKVCVRGVTASFRYPRIQVGRLSTFDMPPPATIYGHLAGVVGDWFDPKGLEFSYVFEHEGKGLDVETAQPIERAGRSTFRLGARNYPVNVRCAPNPQKREFLFRPRMTLYLRGSEGILAEFADGFRTPIFCYVLGRSQDLAECKSIEYVRLSESQEAYFSNTLLPYEWRPWILPGTSVYMPSAVDYRRDRQAEYRRYVQVTRPVLRAFSGAGDITNRSALPTHFLVDESDRHEFADHVVGRGIHFFPVAGPSAETD